MTVTVLQTHSGELLTKTLTKTVDGWHKSNYANAFHFDAFTSDPKSLEELSDILLMLEREDRAAIIRGRLIDCTTSERVRRLSLDHDQGSADDFFNSAATFEDVPCHWVMIDFDKLPADPSLTMGQRHAMLIATIPPEFRGVDYHYQWSSSAGLDGWRTLSAHLWFWLDTPETSENLYARAKAFNWKENYKVDIGLFQSVKFHYTAAPHFVGTGDPLQGQRSGFVRLMPDRPTVSLPAWVPPQPPPT